MNKLNLKEIPIKFNDENNAHQHLMLINGEWVEVAGCSSVADLYQDDGWKYAWPVKLMWEYLKKLFPEQRTDDELDKSKNLWIEERDRAGDSGTLAHKWIETYIKEGNKTEFPNDKYAIASIGEFLKWESEYKPKWLASELQVGHMEHKFCGILDAIAEINGKKILIDFKTSKSIKSHYNIQLAGLWLCLEYQCVLLDGRAILHLPKKGRYKYKEIDTDINTEINDFIVGLVFLNRKNRFLGRNKCLTY